LRSAIAVNPSSSNVRAGSDRRAFGDDKATGRQRENSPNERLDQLDVTGSSRRDWRTRHEVRLDQDVLAGPDESPETADQGERLVERRLGVADAWPVGDCHGRFRT
jgi:hypothetical protein